MSNASAGVFRSSLTTLVVAVVISADRIRPGLQSGCRALSQAAPPATCGDDIDVPAIAWNRSPGGPPAGDSGVGVCPARICTPGAVTSGLMNRPAGPREENAAITSAVPVRSAPAVNDPVTFVWSVRNFFAVAPSARCTVGSQWLSVSMSCSVGLYRIMPTAPPALTLLPLSTRPTPPPRSHATIFPLNASAGGLVAHSPLYPVTLSASTTGAGPTPAVIDAPSNVSCAVPLFRVSVDMNSRRWVDAATVVTHGARWLAVDAPGPLFPADAATNTPAAYASRNASSTGSVCGSVPPETEKLIT
jgi:hypothetical protein